MAQPKNKKLRKTLIVLSIFLFSFLIALGLLLFLYSKTDDQKLNKQIIIEQQDVQPAESGYASTRTFLDINLETNKAKLMQEYSIYANADKEKNTTSTTELSFDLTTIQKNTVNNILNKISKSSERYAYAEGDGLYAPDSVMKEYNRMADKYNESTSNFISFHYYELTNNNKKYLVYFEDDLKVIEPLFDH